MRHPSRIFLSVPHMGGSERRYVDEAFESNWLTTAGPSLVELEKTFRALVGLPSVALASGTSGIHLGLKLVGVRRGDEVVTPTLTFSASCNPILYEGAIPVFVDSERRTWNLDPDRLELFLKRRAKTNQLPRAVTVVHLFGQSADLESIVSICKRWEVPVIEDAAECLGARYAGRHPGTFGDVGVFSFNGNKIITGSTGGMLVSSRQDWVDRARHWSTQARDPDPEGIRNYCHSELGYNYRMSNLVAGIVRGQLEVLEQRVEQRRAVAFRYQEAFSDLPGIEMQPEGSARVSRAVSGVSPNSSSPDSVRRDAERDTRDACAPRDRSFRHTRWLSCFLIDEAKFGLSAADLIRFLDAANIEARPVWKPMHLQRLYQGYEIVGGEVAEDLNRRGICLPSSSSLMEDEQQFVIDRVCEAAKRPKKHKSGELHE